jgi:predicted nucleic acid-binding protein
MTTVLDTNVLVALWSKDDALNKRAQAELDDARARGRMVISGVVYAELLAEQQRNEAFVDGFCNEAGIEVEWEVTERMWRVAGAAFQGYAARRRKQREAGPRRILADFVIGAHALVSGYKLLTLDAGIYAASFPRLAIMTV